MDWTTERAFVTIVLAAAAAVGSTLARAWMLAHPRLVLACILLADTALQVRAATPFVPIGVDESYFAINANALLGADVTGHWIRTPLPVVCGALAMPEPVLPGIVAKQIATLGAFATGRAARGTGTGLLAALLAATGSHLARHCGFFLAEPYGAACLAWLPWCMARGPWWSAAAAAGLGFASRWQLGALLPLALLPAWRRGPRLAVPLALAIAAAPVLLLAPLAGSDPLRAFGHESGRAITVLDRLAVSFHPSCGFGLGLALPIAVLGATRALRMRSTIGVAAVAVFAVHVAATVALGDAQSRYQAPAVPVGAALVALGAVGLGTVGLGTGALARTRIGNGGLSRGVLTMLLVLLIAVPIRAPRTRAEKLASPQAALRTARAEFLTLLGCEVLYTDHDVLAVTAVLAHPCCAVTGPAARHPSGVDLAFAGTRPVCARQDLPAGVLYLTFEPETRAVLWSGAGLFLVRW